MDWTDVYVILYVIRENKLDVICRTCIRNVYDMYHAY